MRRSAALLAAACLLGGSGCSKDENKTGDDKAAAGGATGQPAAEPGKAAGDAAKAEDGAAEAALDPAALAEKIGVEPGPVEYGADEGAAAVLSAAEGKVEIRRVGNETWEEGKADAQLHEGDQVRTGDAATATLTLVDESSVEVAEESAVAIGSRQATEDPASSAAVLYGVARFSVADRAAGEGPFLVFTPGGVVATKGTVYTVGVVASGQSRIGVEEGEVEVAGAAKLDAPISVGAGKVLLIDPGGELGSVEGIGDGDWGAWRDGAEADLDVKAAAEFHAHRAEALETELEAAYAELEVQTAAAGEAEARAEAAEKANDTAAYEAAAPDVGGAVDASFAASLRLQYLTSAMMSDAYVADALYVRHPEVAVIIAPARPRLAGAILWQKKYHAVADLHVEPLRAYYYVHTPVGRARAKLVAYPIPAFYARSRIDYRPAVVSTRVRFAVYRPPVMRASVRVHRKVYVRGPRVGWYASVRTRVRPAPARVRWYVRPKAPRARVVFGARPQASIRVKTVFRAAPPRPRAQAVVRFGGRVNVRGRGGAAVDVRDHRTAVPPAVDVRDHRSGADVRAGAGIRAGAGVRIGGGGAPPAVDVRDHAGAAVRGGAKVRVRAGSAVDVRDRRNGGEAAVRGGVKARVKVREPKVKVKEPKVKGSLRVKGGLKIGH